MTESPRKYVENFKKLWKKKIRNKKNEKRRKIERQIGKKSLGEIKEIEPEKNDWKDENID